MSIYKPTTWNEQKSDWESINSATAVATAQTTTTTSSSKYRLVQIRMANDQVNRLPSSSSGSCVTYGDTTTIDQNHQLLIDLLRMFTDQIESDLTIRVKRKPDTPYPQLNIQDYTNASWMRLQFSNNVPKSNSLQCGSCSSSTTSIDQLKESDPLIKSIFDQPSTTNSDKPSDSDSTEAALTTTTTTNDESDNDEYVTFRVHRNILMCRSRYFRTMLLTDHEWAESLKNEVTIDDISPDTAQILLVFIYTGRVEVHKIEQLFEILVSADRFLMDQLVVALHQKIRAQVTVENALELYHYSRYYQQGCIYDYCFEFFCKNGYRFLHSESPLLTLVVDSDHPKIELLVRLLYCNRFCATEDQIATFVLDYIQVHTNAPFPYNCEPLGMVGDELIQPILQQELINSIRIPLLIDRANIFNQYLSYNSIKPYRFLVESSEVTLLNDILRDCYNSHKLLVQVSNLSVSNSKPVCNLKYRKFCRIRFDFMVPSRIQLKLSTRYCFNQMQFYLSSTSPCQCVLWSWSHFDDGFDSAESGSEQQFQQSPPTAPFNSSECCPKSPPPRVPKNTDGWRKLSSNEAYGRNNLVTIKLEEVCFANKLRLTLEPSGCLSPPMSNDQSVSASVTNIRIELCSVDGRVISLLLPKNKSGPPSTTNNNNNVTSDDEVIGYDRVIKL